MGSHIYLNFLWLVPFVTWFATRNKSQMLGSTIIAASFGLVIPYTSTGLYALYFVWPVSEAFGQFCFYLSFLHDLAGIRIAIFLHLVSAHTPVADDQRLLIEVVNVVSWAIVYGFLGLLWGYFRNKLNMKLKNTVAT